MSAEQLLADFAGKPALEGSALWGAMDAEPERWHKTTASMYDEMLNILPPAAMGRGGFLVGEPYTHNADNEAVYASFWQAGGEYLARYMTKREFRARLLR